MMTMPEFVSVCVSVCVSYVLQYYLQLFNCLISMSFGLKRQHFQRVSMETETVN